MESSKKRKPDYVKYEDYDKSKFLIKVIPSQNNPDLAYLHSTFSSPSQREPLYSNNEIPHEQGSGRYNYYMEEVQKECDEFSIKDEVFKKLEENMNIVSNSDSNNYNSKRFNNSSHKNNINNNNNSNNNGLLKKSILIDSQTELRLPAWSIDLSYDNSNNNL